MRRLPQYHVPRQRLTQACSGQAVVIIEAAGGYGKSVLGAELVNSWWTVGIDVQLDYPDVPASLFASRLRAATLQAGFTDAAAAAPGGDAVEAVDAIMRALAKERCTFVIDDAHNASADAGALITHMATQVDGEQHLVVLARRLPRGAERLRRADHFHLTSKELAFNPTETLTLCRSGFGLGTGPEEAKVLAQATGGWTAATVLAAARAARTGEAAEVVASAASVFGHPEGAVAAILDEAIVALGTAAWPLLAQVARLPLLDQQVVDAVTGEDGFFDRALKAGLPFTPRRGAWWDLPGPVRDHLGSLSPLDPPSMRRAAQDYRQRGELGAALQLLIASGDLGEAAAVLAATPLEDAESMDALELQAVYDQLPGDVVDANPSVLLHVAKAHGVAFHYQERAVLLERAGELAARSGDAVLARAVAAEHVNDLCRAFAYPEAEREAREVLAAAGTGEMYTKARCYYALARALCLRDDGDGPGEARLQESAECFRRSAELYRSIGMRSSASPVLVDLAYLVEFPQGRAAAALARLNEALELVVDRPRRWAWVLCSRARVAAEMGLDDMARASTDEILTVAEQYDDDLLRAYGHYRAAILASYNGRADETLEHVRQTELHRTENWWGQASASFLAEAADCLDRVGHNALAREYLGRAQAEPKNAGHMVAVAAAALEARHGDPVAAEALLARASQGTDRRERWRLTLLGAYAALRRGEHGTAGAMAARAFEEAARMGQPQVPMIRERAVTEQLLGLAAQTGEPAAAALQVGALPLSLSLFGRFALAEAGRPLPLGSGQEAKLLKFVAVSGGRVHVEQAIEALWPEAGREAGRNRMRTVLNRLRGMAGNVLHRSGEMLTLDEKVRVDRADFLAEAARAQALAAADLTTATAVARGAMARYQGQLLPDDLYEDWAEIPRQEAKKVMLELLDLCARGAAARGDLDELRRVIERSIEFDPYDGSRYLRAASTLIKQERPGEALAVLNRARAALSELGLQPPTPLVELERSIVA